MRRPNGVLFMFLVVTIPLAIAYAVINKGKRVSPVLWIAACFVYVWIISKIVWPFFTLSLRHLPSPSGERFFWGNMDREWDWSPGAGYLQVAKELPNESLVAIYGLFHTGHHVLLTTPQTTMEVLNTHAYDWEKPSSTREFLARFLGHGLVNVEGQEHKLQRKAVAPAFSGHHIRNLVPLFWKKALDFNEVLSNDIAKNPVIEIGQLISRATLDIIGSACMGKDLHTLENPNEELASFYTWLTDMRGNSMWIYAVLNYIFGSWIVDHLPWKFSGKVLHAQHRLRYLVKRLLLEKKLDEGMSYKERKDIISIIARSGEFSDDYLVDQALTFLAAGHETTASALTWASYLLSKHQDCQTKLREECVAHLSKQRNVDMDVLENMPYLNAVVMETLRLFPPVPITVRVAVRETRISDRTIPKGTVALIVPWMLNRLPALWGEDSEIFNPSRWLDGRATATGAANHPYSLLTFLYGPRSCIGQLFSRTEFKCLLAAFVMRFKFEMKDPDEEIIPEGVITVKPKSGLNLVVREVRV